jgi:PAP2 superfamily
LFWLVNHLGSKVFNLHPSSHIKSGPDFWFNSKLSRYTAFLGSEGYAMASVDTDLLATQNSTLSWRSGLSESFAVHGLLLGLAMFYLLVFKTVGFLNAQVIDTDPIWTFLSLLLFAVFASTFSMVIIQFYCVATVDKSDKPIQDLFRRMKALFRHRDTMMRGIPMFLALLTFMYAFTLFKANISRFNPYSWDVTFDHLDQVIHFGTRPWEWVQPVFGNIAGTFVLNVNYNLWFMVMQMFLVYFSFLQSPGIERTRFYLCFFLICSIGGTLMATIFSSAGPCYFGHFVEAASPYAALTQYLQDVNKVVPIWAVDTQDMLWNLRNEGSIMGGISAMPSVHNATALLFVLTTWNMSKWLRNLLIVHMILIFLGSIHLGWHYAVDAYFAWAITLVLWVAAHHIAKRWEAQPKIQSFNAQCSSNI